jgi:hypothetical protein
MAAKAGMLEQRLDENIKNQFFARFAGVCV